MSQQNRAKLTALAGLVVLLVVIGVWWGVGALRDSQQDRVLSDLSDVVAQSEADVADDTADPEPADDTTDAGDRAESNEAEPTPTTPPPPATTTTAPGNETTTTTSTTEVIETETTGVPATTPPESTTPPQTSTDDEPPEITTTTTTTTAAPTTTTTTTTAPPATTQAPAPQRGGTPAVATFEVLETLPHDTGAFTQGLEISDGRLFESTGLVGRSSIRELDLETGEIIRNVAVPTVFAEGITIVGDTAIQLTWQDQIAFRYDLETFDVIESYSYEGQGWGLCLASGGSGNLVMSDGTSELEFRDPDTFESLGFVEVTLDGEPIANLNELECVGDTVWANIWLSSLVIEIDPRTGDVLTVFDADELRPNSTRNDSGAVWNGLAYDPSDGTLLLTGKLWPTIFRLDISTTG